MTTSPPSVYDHYRTARTDYKDGVYRVVGVNNETVILLRVGDADGRRVNTGELITMSMDEIENFERSENPDGNRSLGDIIVSVPETTYWSVLAFVKEASSHPLPASVAIFLILVGLFGEGFLPVPNAVFGVLILIGGLFLAYVGSGRM